MNIHEYEYTNHSSWECKYHIVFIPKYRKKSFFGLLRREIGPVLRKLASQKACEIIEGYTMPDHVHILISIPPKYSVSQIVGYIKGKSAIYIARHYRGKERNFTGEKFWARGYFVSTVGSNYRNGANANYKDSFPYHNGNCIALSSPKINNLIHALNDKCNGSLS